MTADVKSHEGHEETKEGTKKRAGLLRFLFSLDRKVGDRDLPVEAEVETRQILFLLRVFLRLFVLFAALLMPDAASMLAG